MVSRMRASMACARSRSPGFQQRAGNAVRHGILFWIARIYFFSERGRLDCLAAFHIQAQQHRRRFAAVVAVRKSLEKFSRFRALSRGGQCPHLQYKRRPGAMDPVAGCGRPGEWLRRGRLDPKSSAWRCGTFQWILSAAPWKGAVPPGVFGCAGYRARLPAACATAARPAAGAPPSIAFRRAANRGAAPRSSTPCCT